MKSFKYSLIASALLLAGCGVELQETETVDTPQISQEEKRANSLNNTETFYAFPANGQSDVAVNSSVLLAFSHQLDDYESIELKLTDSTGSVVEVVETRLAAHAPAEDDITERSFADYAHSVTFKPTSALKPGEIYTVSYAIKLIDENNTGNDFTASNETTFTTRIATNGSDFALDVNGLFPSADLPFTTFTSLRLRLTNEVNTDTLIAGETFKFQKVGTTEQVAGELIAKGRYLTFDPANDLEDDASYELIITDAVKDIAGNSFSPVNRTFVAAYAGVRSYSTMNVTDNQGIDVASPYSGESFNAVTIQSVLIGNKDTTYVKADLITELANLGKFKGSAPLVIRKGTIMNSSELSVKVGGEFSTGFKTGNIRMTTISDATGFLIENLNSDHKYAPKQLHMLMDVAMTTDGELDENQVFVNGKANGGLSQNIMHLEILGTVRTVGTKMVIDAVGEIDLTILGVDNANAQVSFHMESYTEDTAPEIPADTVSPFLQSAYPGMNTTHFSLGDNINYTYNEPLELASLQNITLTDADNNVVATRVSQDGSAIVIDPVANLASATTYTARGALQDLAGNPAYLQQSFTTPYKTQETRKTSPLVEGMVPGYACALTEANYGADIAGRCAGGFAGGSLPGEDNKPEDKKFNIFSLQEDREIFIAFSQQLDEASLVLGNSCDTGSFRVEIVNTSGTCLETVPGVMSYKNKILTFAPYENWKDQGDNIYRYSLMSAQNVGKGGVDCGNGSAICSDAGYPLQTTLLMGAEDQGGPDIRMPFRAAPADNLVFNPLMMPTTDTNRDYRWSDNDEAVYDGNFARLSLSKFDGGITKAKLGCDYEETCGADKSTTYISGFMPTEVGEYDPIHDRIPVKIHAQTLTSSDVYVKTTVISILPEPVPTGTMVMRPLYPVIDGKTTVPEGYITKDSEGKLKFSIYLEVYMDSPYMEPPLNSKHNLHSELIELYLEGPVTFLDDGRMNIQLSNTNKIDLDVVIETLDIIDSYMTMSILPGTMSLNQISLPMK
jgi:hypothetical protein